AEDDERVLPAGCAALAAGPRAAGAGADLRGGVQLARRGQRLLDLSPRARRLSLAGRQRPQVAECRYPRRLAAEEDESPVIGQEARVQAAADRNVPRRGDVGPCSGLEVDARVSANRMCSSVNPWLTQSRPSAPSTAHEP